MKPIGLIILMALAMATFVQADQVYKWVDAQGNVHYSDKPHPGAKKVEIAPPQSYSAPNIGSAEGRNKALGEPAAAANRQYSISIASPQPEATITNSHSVTVSVNVKPGLAAGDTITFQLDGKQRGPVAETSVTFDDLDRGQHQVTATLKTAAGQTIQATPVTFYLRQPTVFHGKPPQ